MHGVEYVRWETVNGYLRRFGFSQHFGKQAGIHAHLLCLRASLRRARYCGYRYHTEIKQENFYNDSLYQVLIVGAKKQ